MSQLTATRTLLSGNEAIARGAWEAGVDGRDRLPRHAVHGDPRGRAARTRTTSTASGRPTRRSPSRSLPAHRLPGARAIVTMKHVGLNVAADPLMTLSYIGTVGGLVIVVADDPGMHSSQNEQDTRHYARFAKVPMLEPSDSQEAKDFLVLGPRDLREALHARASCGPPRGSATPAASVDLGERAARRPDRSGSRRTRSGSSPSRCTRGPCGCAWRSARPPCAAAANASAPTGSSGGTAASGSSPRASPTSTCGRSLPGASVLKLGWVVAVPGRADPRVRRRRGKAARRRGAGRHPRRARAGAGHRLRGTSRVPGIGERRRPSPGSASSRRTASAASCERQPRRSSARRPRPRQQDLPARPPVLCPGCPHRGIFYALGKFDVVVTGDIGCYSLGVFPPLKRHGHDPLHGRRHLHGARHADGGRRGPEPPHEVVGMVGDSTFFHSGITGLLDIVYNKGAAVDHRGRQPHHRHDRPPGPPGNGPDAHGRGDGRGIRSRTSAGPAG